MTRCLIAGLSALWAVCSYSPVFAQGERLHQPNVIAVMPGADRFYEDMEYVYSLTTPTEQKQWPVTRDYLDIFLFGIDRTLPGRMDILLDSKVERYRPSFPIENLRTFRKDNLETLGIENRRVAGTLYRLSEAFEGYMRYKDGYATIGERRDDVPFDMPNPIEAAGPLLKLGYDFVAVGTNGPEGQADRQTAFEEDARELLSALQRTEEETPDQFAMRKLLYEHQLDEFQRIYVQGKQLQLAATIDREKSIGLIDALLYPLADTDLQKSLEDFEQKPAYFANVPRTEENRIASGRATIPLDSMRQENLLELSQLMRTTQKEKAGEEEGFTDEERKARVEMTDLFFDLLDANVKNGLFDGFLEGHSNGEEGNTVIGGVWAVDGTAMVPILKLFPAARQGQEVEIDADKEGDVQIHKVTVSAERYPEFRDFVGGQTLYVGTSEHTIWFAAGPGALEELKKVIQEVAKPNTGKADDPFLIADMKLLPWTRLWDQMQAGQGNAKLRKMALEAFAVGEDHLDLKLDRVDDHIDGRMNLAPGVLRLIGKYMADFSRENFDEDGG